MHVSDGQSKWNIEKYPLQEQLFLGLVLFLTVWGQGRKTNTFLKANHSAGTHRHNLTNAGRATSDLTEVQMLTYTTNFDWWVGLCLNKTWKYL